MGRVHRLSVGVQSFDDNLLRQMQRFDKYGSGEQILRRIEEVAGNFLSLNVDLIFNFPSQTREILQADIEKAVSSAANQVTFYPLMTSPLVSQSLSHTIGAVGVKNENAFYRQIQEGLQPNFVPKSAWTFARRGEGMIDEYIVEGNDYVGCGSGAFSYLDGTLYVNSFSLKSYRQALDADHIPLSKSLSFSRHSRMRYHFLMNLFGLRLDKTDFQRRFGSTVEAALPLEMAYLWATGSFLRNDPKKIQVTPRGQYMMLVMMREFFSNMDRIRQQARLDILPDEIAECQHGQRGFAAPFQTGNKINP
jgi:menaquinone C8-methyltransferase